MEVSDERELGVSLVPRGWGDRAGEEVEPLVSRETGRERRGPEWQLSEVAEVAVEVDRREIEGFPRNTLVRVAGSWCRLCFPGPGTELSRGSMSLEWLRRGSAWRRSTPGRPSDESTLSSCALLRLSSCGRRRGPK